MKWVCLSVWSPEVVREPMADFLVEQTSRGVEFKGNWIKAYCRQGEEARYCLKQLHRYYQDLQQLYPELPTLKVLQEDLQNEDWAESWKTFFKPIRIGKSIVVKPSWEPYESTAHQVVIEIDPERAFGTGNHPSTALCIEILEHILGSTSAGEGNSGLSVLDVGTGSGILGIVAARLGAQRVLGLEIDPEALEAAQRNVERNGVVGIMSVSLTPLDQVEQTFDVVVANLTASLIAHLADDLAGHVSAKGLLLLSGILAEQVEEVAKCFETHYFKMVKSWSKEEWQAILMRRKKYHRA
ncbi:MAG: 50S ribosomal protein L11 methyltransferase [Gammaproteobacteria bacterium]|nr:50S ribosomal protein L11 methyltransferase [Gammaproteobacteria bacterium]NIQ92101.1 50S ribosomal protein L11 methyltransferase [Deltaproteobacteria bacterium]